MAKTTLQGRFTRRRRTEAVHPNRWGYLGGIQDTFPPCEVEKECLSLPELRKQIIDRYCKIHGVAGPHVFRKRFNLILRCMDENVTITH